MGSELLNETARTQAGADDFHNVLFLRITITGKMGAMKGRRNVATGLLDLQLEGLALITKGERSLMPLL